MSTTDYSKRLILPVEGQPDIRFYTGAGTLIAAGYERVVLGERGPYIEFRPEQLNYSVLVTPADQKWRHLPQYAGRAYYCELRSQDQANVKVYVQRKTVAYADYRIGLAYISPFDLTSDRYPKLITDRPSERAQHGENLFPLLGDWRPE